MPPLREILVALGLFSSDLSSTSGSGSLLPKSSSSVGGDFLLLPDNEGVVASSRRGRVVVRHIAFVLPSMVSVETVIVISSSGVANTVVSVFV